jgi:WD40 repeat protein
VRCPPLPPTKPANFVTSLAFSSDQGGKSILAVARHNGSVTLWSLLEARPRFEAPHPCPASCVAFRPTTTRLQSMPSGMSVEVEDLIVGDDNGRIYYYSVEWPSTGPSSMTLLKKLNAHSQNICGLAWAPDGRTFVSGGNDNVALLFTVDEILSDTTRSEAREEDQSVATVAEGSQDGNVAKPLPMTPPTSPERSYIRGSHPNLERFSQPTGAAIDRAHIPLTPPSSNQRPRHVPKRWKRRRGSEDMPTLWNTLADPTIPGIPNLQTFTLYHAAAVKAVAFAPWQANLLATGGGSNDRQIHFYHTGSGAALAVINVFAQVTSLV